MRVKDNEDIDKTNEIKRWWRYAQIARWLGSQGGKGKYDITKV